MDFALDEASAVLERSGDHGLMAMLQETVKHLDNEVEFWKAAHDEAQQDLDTLAKEYEEEISRLADKIDKLEAGLDELQTKVKRRVRAC